MEIPFNKWRHDLRATINTMENIIKLLEGDQPPDPELVAVAIESLRKSQDKLEKQYVDVYSLQREAKTSTLTDKLSD